MTFFRMRRLRASLAWTIGLAAALLLLLGSAPPPPRAHKSPKPCVVLISMDGVRWDYTERDRLPAFAAMAKGGVKAGRLEPPFPSLTFPSHATLATGCVPSRHGIVANSFLDVSNQRRFSDEAEASWLQEPPLWVLAQRAGLKSAVSGWPCSSGPWEGVRPFYYRPFQEGSSDGETVDWLLDLLQKPAGERPDLIMAWTHGADGAGHAEGPDGPGVHRAMAAADALLARLRGAIASLGPSLRVDLVVVSDHGMASVNRMVDLSNVVPKRGFFPYIAVSGPVCNLYVKGEAQREQVARGLKKLPPEVSAFASGALPSALEYVPGPRVGDFVLVCPPGETFKGFRSGRGKAPPRGMHGYIPTERDMGAIFFAEGPDIKAGTKIDLIQAADVAPTLCTLLGIPPPPHADGHAVPLSPR
jgi:predicted AlkP superfamily pyrophosphatase or phosphodiesterase